MYDIVIGRSEAERQKYGSKGAIFLGKHYVKMGQTTSLSNMIYMDVSRSHVAFIVGKRGSGKCLHGDTLITLADGSLMPIKELEHKDNDILSLDEDLKIIQKPKESFFKRAVDKLLKVTFRSGKEIMLTPEHPLLTLQGWSPAISLPIGSRIATPRIQPAFGEYDAPEGDVKLLAYLIAEGHLGNHFILFTNGDDAVQNDFAQSVKGFDHNLVLKPHGRFSVRISDPSIKRKIETGFRDSKGKFLRGIVFDKKNSLRKFLEREGLYPSLAATKKIPQSICRLPKNKLALFLNRLFSCDGSLYKKKTSHSSCWQISYSSSSRALIQQLQSLLSRFGVLGRVRVKKYKQFISWEMVIDGVGVYTFLQEIGFFGKKEIRQQLALQETPKKRNPNVDTIPIEIWERYKPENWAAIGREFGYRHPKALRESARYAPSREKLLQIALIDGQEALQKIAKSDIFWDTIIAAEEVEGSFEVYDISVPESHNFVANDIIVHNSYTMGVVAEGISDLPDEIKSNIAVVMLDTMGIYWTMKYPNEKEIPLVREWGLDPKGLNITVYTPKGFYLQQKEEGILTDKPFSIKPSELDASDWCLTFGIAMTSPQGVAIESIIEMLVEQKKDFGLKEIIAAIQENNDFPAEVKLSIINRFRNAERWGLFDDEGTPLHDLVKGGQVTVLDVSCYVTAPGTQGLRALVIGLIAEKLFVERMIARKGEEVQSIKETTHFLTEKSREMQKEPLVWLVIDEAHEFLPLEGETPASHPLITILREGRQPGISLILASQQPGKIHSDVMTQSDIVIAHRITANVDVTALGQLMQSYMREGLDKQLNMLPRLKGSAVIFDDNNERLFAMRIRPRLTWHGGESPMAMKDKKETFE
ncbi:hypothetical protein HYU14_03570 [Candidatus Woesearchaeota archaeon]|nr:hypothetical protein [Candidatus Woesearchaeota archaeon]